MFARTLLLTFILATIPTQVTAQNEADLQVPVPDDCRVYFTDMGTVLACGTKGEACGFGTQSTCWTVRFTCYWIGNPASLVGVLCQTQPGCCGAQSTTATPGTAGGAAQPQSTAESCTTSNYGIQLEPHLFFSDCHRICENHGIWISVSFPTTNCAAGCSSDGVELRVGPSCRGSFLSGCIGEECVSPCQSCPVPLPAASRQSGSTSTWWECAIVVMFPGTPTTCDPCSDTNAPVLIVGVVSCDHNCVNSFVQASVGLLECSACGNEGITIWVGQRCDDWGIGACIGYDPCFGSHRDLPVEASRRTMVAK